PRRHRPSADARVGARADLFRLLFLRRELLVLSARAAGSRAPRSGSHGSVPLVGDPGGHRARGGQAGPRQEDRLSPLERHPAPTPPALRRGRERGTPEARARAPPRARGPPPPGAPAVAALPAQSQARVLEVSHDYLEYLRASGKAPPEAPPDLARRLLLERSR